MILTKMAQLNISTKHKTAVIHFCYFKKLISLIK